MSALYISKFNGPSDFSVKQPNDNNITNIKMGMPFKPATMAEGNMFSLNRQAYNRMKQQEYSREIENNVKKTTTAYYLGSRRFLISTSKATASLANKYLDSSQYTNIETINAVGKSSVNLNSKKMSFGGGANVNDVRTSLRKCRSSGYVVHKK
jgi:hypothetical protein